MWELPPPPTTASFAPVVFEGTVYAAGDLVAGIFDADGVGPQARRLVIAGAD